MKQVRVERSAALPPLFVGELHSTEVAIGKVAEERVLEHVVPIPFDDRPVELLPPRPGDDEPGRARLAHRRDRRWSQEIALQVPIRAQFLESLWHSFRGG